MHWNTRYAIRSYLRSALWIVPLITLVLEQIAIRIVGSLESYSGWIPVAANATDSAIGAMDVIAGEAISFLVFTFGSMLVAIQVASGQLTPRIIATTLLRNNVIRFTVGLFVFTLLFAAGARSRIIGEVPNLTVAIAVVLGISSIVALLFLIDYTARLLRPIAIVWRLGEQGLRVIDEVYPNLVEDPHAPSPPRPHLGAPVRTLANRGPSAIVLAVNLKALVAMAKQAGGVIEFVPRIGDFVAADEPVFRLYGGAAALTDEALCAEAAFGPERTIEQDSLFAFRVIVDIAVKALSSAINDPTTAVLAIDQLQRLLRRAGKRHLHDDVIQDEASNLRVILPTPDWNDFVQISVREIRLYGASNFQVARRLRAMLENLISTLPAARHPALRLELDLLDRTLERLNMLPEDLALAREPDLTLPGRFLHSPGSVRSPGRPAYTAGARACQSVACSQAQPMRSAIASSPPRHTTCRDVGSPDLVIPFGSARAHRSRKFTHRVIKAGVVDWSISATTGAGVRQVGVSSASIPAIAAAKSAFSRRRSASTSRYCRAEIAAPARTRGRTSASTGSALLSAMSPTSA